MKKLLNILLTFGLVGVASFSLLSCEKNNKDCDFGFKRCSSNNKSNEAIRKSFLKKKNITKHMI